VSAEVVDGDFAENDGVEEFVSLSDHCYLLQYNKSNYYLLGLACNIIMVLFKNL
jgi:hypothetical protein